jgi:hypothetical protein
MAMAVTSRVPTIKGRNPKSPRTGCQDVEKRRWDMVVFARIGFDFMKRTMAMKKAMAFTNMSDARIDNVANLSLDRLADTGNSLCSLLFQFFQRLCDLLLSNFNVTDLIHIFLPICQYPFYKRF